MTARASTGVDDSPTNIGVRLRRATACPPEVTAIATPAATRGPVLGRPDLRLFDGEASREGTLVTRADQFARWTDGSTHSLPGGRRMPGSVEGVTDIRYYAVCDAT